MDITESFVSDLTTNLQVVANRSYEARNKNLWWTRVASQRRSQSKRQILAWLLDQWKLHIECTDGNNGRGGPSEHAQSRCPNRAC